MVRDESVKTIILEKPGELRLTDTPPPSRAGEAALVRVRRIGICGTDMHAFRGRQPFFTCPRILGHELGVEIVEVGTNPAGLKPGDHCAVEPYLNCGHCIACRAGKTNCCTQLQVMGVHTDGGMREFIAVPASKLHKSDRLSLDQLALIETLGIGAHAVDRAQLQRGEFALVIGAGPIGLAVLQFARLAGGKLIVMDLNPDRLRFAQEQFRVEHLVHASEHALRRLLDITGGDMPTAVFDATGNPASVRSAFSFVAHGGRLVLVGLFQGDVVFADPEFHRREMMLLASRNSTAADFCRIIAAMESGQIDTAPWITHRSSFDGMISEFPKWLRPETGVVKAMVEL
jgi:2-desacetyl-2-hydroxyethyl bacteriochlorophyllide A dehydrogenase